MCLAPGEYNFTITDSVGDGICCGINGNGGYILKVDGTEVACGGDFGSGETQTFTVSAQPTAPKSPAALPTAPTCSYSSDASDVPSYIPSLPLKNPSSNPSVASFVNPSFIPSFSPLDSCLRFGNKTVVLELKTDTYPGETAWDIKNSSGDKVYDGSEYSMNNETHLIDMCLAPGEYNFTITDSFGNGICCGINGNGGYILKVDGTEVACGGDFGSGETQTFTVSAQPTAPKSPAALPTAP